MSEEQSLVSAPKLLDQVRGKIRLKHYSIRTEQATWTGLSAISCARRARGRSVSAHCSVAPEDCYRTMEQRVTAHNNL